MAEVLIVLKRNATDPPGDERYVWTDEGEARYLSGLWLGCDGPIDPHWWCDFPRPVEGKPLTVAGLRDLAELGTYEADLGSAYVRATAVRLSAALDALTREGAA